MLRREQFIKLLCGVAGSSLVLWLFWTFILLPLGWPEMRLVGGYFAKSTQEVVTYKAMLMTGFRALCGAALGFSLAVVLGVLTGKTRWGWIAFFLLLMLLQKIPAIAMVHVLVNSRLGIGFAMTVTLAAIVVMTFTWQILHHRASTIDAREIFSLRLLGFRGVRLFLYGFIPHLGSALGGAARIGITIALMLVVLGEWQGVWSDGTIWQHGLGIEISRCYESMDSEARILAYCVWLGILGIGLDLLIQATLRGARTLFGVDFRR